MNKKREQIMKEEEGFVKTNAGLIGLRKRSRFSAGELRIASFFKDNGIEFYNEFFFKDLKVDGKRKMLFYDFYLPEYNLVVEFDGEQHYTGEFNGKKLDKLRTYDFIKTAFCRSMKINILRIKYSDIDKVEEILCEKFDKLDPIKKPFVAERL